MLSVSSHVWIVLNIF